MQFAIHAIRDDALLRLTIDATDAQDARVQVEARGCSVLSIKAQGAASRRGWLRLGAPGFPLLQFNQSLVILLRAGLSIVEAVQTLAERETRPDIQRVITELHRQLAVGMSFSAALAQQPLVFPPLFVASVHANEQTGALLEAIERFNLYRAQADQVRKRVLAASIYPAMILAVGGLVIAFLLFYVVPRFSVVFEDMGDRIPAMSRLLLDWGRLVRSHGAGVGLLMVAMLFSAWRLARWAPARAAWVRAVQRLPRVGEQMHVYQLTRFYRALGMLLQAGMPVVQALDLAIGMLPAHLHAALATARREIIEGKAMSVAFEHQGLTTPVSLRLLRVGERSGALGDMLERTASFHDEDIAQAVDWFVRLFEPLLMVVIGLVIGLVVLLMYAPIFELAGSLQ